MMGVKRYVPEYMVREVSAEGEIKRESGLENMRKTWKRGKEESWQGNVERS